MSEAFDDVCVVSMARTPFGSFGGGLSSLSATDLGAICIREALSRANISGGNVDQVFMGNVASANLGQAPAKQAALKAGIPVTVPCTTINKVCSSGMKSVTLGCLSLLSGESNVVVCGGMESMSNVPFYSEQTRFGGAKFGNVTLVDGLKKDALCDPSSNDAMGNFATLTACKYDISRDMQDDYAAESYKRAKQACEQGKFKLEIAPVQVKNRRKVVTVEKDEEPTARPVTRETLRALKPAFSLPHLDSAKPFGNSPHQNSVTAGNASVISDGAAVLVMTKLSYARKFNLPILSVITSWGDSSDKPEDFPTAPAKAMQLALGRSELDPHQVDVWEINEAFSSVPIVNAKLLDIPLEKVNIYGGAVSLGHPVGASGTRIICSAISALVNERKTLACCGICNGGGGASACVLVNINSEKPSKL